MSGITINYTAGSLSGWINLRDGTGSAASRLQTELFTPVTGFTAGDWYDFKVTLDFNAGSYGELTGVAYRATASGDTGAWTNITMSSVALGDGAANHVTIAPKYMGLDQDNHLYTGRVYADDLQITPEPATIGLLCLGAIGLLRRKK